MFKGLKKFRETEFIVLANNEMLFYYIKNNLKKRVETDWIVLNNTFRVGLKEKIMDSGSILDVWNRRGLPTVLEALLRSAYTKASLKTEIRYFQKSYGMICRLVEQQGGKNPSGKFPVDLVKKIKEKMREAERWPENFSWKDFVDIPRGVAIQIFTKNPFGINEADDCFIFPEGKGKILFYEKPSDHFETEVFQINYSPSDAAREEIFLHAIEGGFKTSL